MGSSGFFGHNRQTCKSSLVIYLNRFVSIQLSAKSQNSKKEEVLISCISGLKAVSDDN
jgi:hypothetical protein